MAKPFVFKMHWDENIQMLHVSCGDHEMSFSKEYLEDTPSWQLIEMFDKLSSGTKGNWTSQYMNEPPPHKPANFTKHINKSKWEELLLPGIRKYWNELTGGWAETCTYSYETETYNIVFSQGMCAKLPRQLFDDQQYDYIREILQALAGILQKYNGSLGSFDYKTITGTIYTIELSWQIKTDQQAMAKMLEKNMKFASLYKMSDEGIAKLMEAAMPKALHVYDLGDGMLVPCELAAEIVKWSKLDEPQWWMAKEMVEDDLYGVSPAAIASLAKKVDAAILTEQLEAYPGKVFFIDDSLQIQEAMNKAAIDGGVVKIAGAHADLIIADDPFKTDKDSWFVDNSKINSFFESEELFNFLSKVNSHLNGPPAKPYYGIGIAEQMAATVTIPKKPKQITKESLAHFHKLLGGKKNPF